MKCWQIKGEEVLEGIDASCISCDPKAVKDGRVFDAVPDVRPFEKALVPESLSDLVSRSRVRLVAGVKGEGALLAVSPEEWMPDFEHGDLSKRVGMSGSLALLECQDGATFLMSTRLDNDKVVIFNKQFKVIKGGENGDPNLVRGIQNPKKARKDRRKTIVQGDRGSERGAEDSPTQRPVGDGADVPCESVRAGVREQP